MNAYTVVDVTPDTVEWEAERRSSVGASEVAAVLGLSPYGTPLDVYKSKHGHDRQFDPLLSFVGHASEIVIEKWVSEYAGLNVVLKPSFMARSREWPFLHASFDRVSEGPFTTWQFKTASQYASHHWDEGIPTDYRVQVQAEMAVAGTERAAVVVWIGGREFRLFWERRDDKFIRETLAPRVGVFWDDVQAGRAPLPSTPAELNEVPVEPGKTLEADDTVMEAIARRAVLLSDAKAQEAEADQLKVAIGNWLGDADTITRDGRTVLTFRYQKGRTLFNAKRFREDNPDLAAHYMDQGAGFRVMRTMKGALE